MAKLSADGPVIAEGCEVKNSSFGAYTHLHEGCIVLNSSFGDYSYAARYADIANTEIGKFSNIASFVRIGPTDHPMDRASLHHFLYRSGDYFEGAERDHDFFAHRASRKTQIGHDTWIGHGAVIRPEINVGHGAVVGAMSVVTKDVPDYTIVVGNPARVVRQRFPDEIAEQLKAMAWWDWSHDVIGKRLEDFRRLPIEAFLERYS